MRKITLEEATEILDICCDNSCGDCKYYKVCLHIYDDFLEFCLINNPNKHKLTPSKFMADLNKHVVKRKLDQI